MAGQLRTERHRCRPWLGFECDRTAEHCERDERHDSVMNHPTASERGCRTTTQISRHLPQPRKAIVPHWLAHISCCGLCSAGNGSLLVMVTIRDHDPMLLKQAVEARARHTKNPARLPLVVAAFTQDALDVLALNCIHCAIRWSIVRCSARRPMSPRRSRSVGRTISTRSPTSTTPRAELESPRSPRGARAEASPGHGGSADSTRAQARSRTASRAGGP